MVQILCLSNLAWERTLFQRPQQLMTRFARLGCPVLYAARTSSRRWARMAAGERSLAFESCGRAVNLPFLPLSGRLRQMNDLSLRRVLQATAPFMQKIRAQPRVLWLQHPDYVAIADRIPHEILVYDAMDPFGAFSRTPEWVLDRERELTRRANVVFTGGRSLHAQRASLNPNTHCFPSGIDFDHFARAAASGDVPPEMAALAKPVLGYFGAVDERIDWELVRTLCGERPEWNVVFIGPLAGMAWPPFNAPNFHYLGPRKYDVLPDYLRTFDVALIPWKVNELTRYMSPTKTPEYLAAGRPVVSVAIPDVENDYAEEVLIGRDANEFINCCERAIAAGTTGPLKPPRALTWEETAERMLEIIMKAAN